jgi:hypothetical protein
MPGLAALWVLAAGVAIGMPLTADEAYYLDWSRSLAWGYFDHPPGVAVWVWLGGGHPRLPALLFFPVTAWLLARAAAAWGVDAASRFPLVVIGTPIGLAGLGFATPDTPLFPLTAALLWALGARRFGAAGVLIGVSVLVKSSALLWLPGVLVIAVGARRAITVAVAVVVTLAPHLAWSMAHGGLPYTFQAGRMGQGFHLPEAVFGQLLVVTPGLGWLGLRALGRVVRDAAVDDRDRTLALLGGSQLGAWGLLACTTRVEANWPAFAWLPVLLLLARRPTPAFERAHRFAGGATLAAALGVVVLGRWGPPAWGPPRNPEALSACVPSTIEPVAARYQERALLAAVGREVPYWPAAGGRRSEYDGRPGPPRPVCGFTYLAPASALGDRCPGPVVPTEVCGRPATFCRCPGDLAP